MRMGSWHQQNELCTLVVAEAEPETLVPAAVTQSHGSGGRFDWKPKYELPLRTHSNTKSWPNCCEPKAMPSARGISCVFVATTRRKKGLCWAPIKVNVSAESANMLLPEHAGAAVVSSGAQGVRAQGLDRMCQ